MLAAYLLMAAGLVSFAGMGIVHKLGDRYGAQPLGIALFAMLTASAVSFLYTALFQGAAIHTIPPRVMLLAVPFGASAAIGLWLFQRGLRYGHIATSWLLINLSSGIPTVLSILFYREPLNLKRMLVFLLVIASLLLLWWDRRKQLGEEG
ncbi:MAG: EamA family transporter [Acidobacteriaceae bacterium]|nr:EamA family transporter [Acidobacteriaceae bacterium]